MGSYDRTEPNRTTAAPRDRLDGLRTVRARRGLVIAGYLLMVAAAMLSWSDPAVAWPVPLLYLLGFGVCLVLRSVLRSIDGAPDTALDERQIALRNAAYRTAYMAVVTVTAAAIVALMFHARFLTGDVVEARHLETLFLTLLLGATLTPPGLVAWREREI
jgi:hypothetical protein